MKSANHPFACGQGMIFLNKVKVNAELLERAFPKNLGEEATLIDVPNGAQYSYFGDSSFRSFHVLVPLQV